MKTSQLTFFSPDHKTACEIPLSMAAVQAGFPSPADDFMEQKLDLNQYLIRHPAATFFVRVEGDSMKGANIHPGDILIVDRALEATNGKIVIAIVNGEFTVKRIRVQGEEVFLEAENPAFPPIRAQGELNIWGVVTHVIHKCLH